MPWKKNGDALAIGSDGNPVWIDTAGQESAVSGDTITRLNGEAANHRKDKEAALAKLAAFGDLTPEAAKEAVEKLKTVDLSKMVDAGKLEEVRAALTKEFQSKLEAKDAELRTMNETVKADKLAAAFATSKFVTGKLALAPDLVQNLFGNHFDVRDGKVVALDANKTPITSSKNFGEVADFEEAIECIVTQHPSKDSLMVGVKGGGTGGNGNGGGGGIKRTVTRAEEAKMTHEQRRAFMDAAAKGDAELVD